MAITLRQSKTVLGTSTASLSLAFDSAVLGGSLIVACINTAGNSSPISSVSDNVNAGNYANDGTYTVNVAVGGGCAIYSKANASAGATTVTLAQTAANCSLTILELVGADTSSPADVSGSYNTNTADVNPSISLTTSLSNECIIACGNAFFSTTAGTITAGSNFTMVQQQVYTGTLVEGEEYWLDAGAAGSKTVGMTYSGGSGSFFPVMVAVAYKNGPLSTGGVTVIRTVPGGTGGAMTLTRTSP